MALALELAQAVVEWHQASPEERHSLRGYYIAPAVDEFVEPIERGVPQEEAEDVEPSEKPQVVQNNDSEGDEEVQAVIEPVDVEKEYQPMEIVKPSEPEFTVKTEETEQPGLADVPNGEVEDHKPDISEARDMEDSKNPILYSIDAEEDPEVAEYREIRHPIENLDGGALWVSPTELASIQAKKETDKQLKPEWDRLFSDLLLYDMDSPPGSSVVPRNDEVQSESIPISRFADSQPLLLGALQPSLRLNDGEWRIFDQTPVSPDEGQRPVPLRSRGGTYIKFASANCTDWDSRGKIRPTYHC